MISDCNCWTYHGRGRRHRRMLSFWLALYAREPQVVLAVRKRRRKRRGNIAIAPWFAHLAVVLNHFSFYIPPCLFLIVASMTFALSCKLYTSSDAWPTPPPREVKAGVALLGVTAGEGPSEAGRWPCRLVRRGFSLESWSVANIFQEDPYT